MPSLRAALLAVCCAAAAFTAAAIEGCTPASCILPVPLPAPPRSSLAENLQLIRCHLSCISEQHIDIQLVNQGTTWPSFSYSSLPCTSRQKVDQCTTGCMTKHRTPNLTVNRCRDQCVSECETSRESDQDACESTCRRTFCRYGCNMYQSLQAESNTAFSTPTAAPVITSHPDSDSARKLFVSNISAALPSQQTTPGLSNITPQNISYLYKIQHGNDISYIWQKYARMPLDLSPFACNQIQVSFSVVAESGHSEFSPAQTLCLDGVGRWPSGVNHTSINISYAEDTRGAYHGYSTANISWTKPQDHEYLTSYTIFIYTRTERCGGLNNMYTYRNIRKDATRFLISATEPNGVPMFGCSYTISVVPMPERPNRNRPTLTMAPELVEPDPEMRLYCRREWDERGFINISVNWTLSSPSPLPAIRRFTVVPLLIDSSQPGLFGRLSEYSRHWIAPEDEMNYSMQLANFPPQRTQSYKYKIEVRVERASGYLWRRVPPTETCTLSAESEPPSPVTELTVGHVQIDREGGKEEGYLAQFDLSWSPPLTANGALAEYEVNIVTQPSGDGPVLYHSTHPASQLSMEVNITFPLNTSTHCVYALVRSRNDYAWSEWNKPEIVPLDEKCQPSVSNASNESVTLFYKRAGEEAIRIAQISCQSGLDTAVSNTLADKLLSLEQRLESVSDAMRVQSVAESLLERLRTLESKIDQILDAVSSQSGSGG